MTTAISTEIKGPVLLHIKRGKITYCEVLGHTETVKALDAFVETALSSALTTNTASEEQK